MGQSCLVATFLTWSIRRWVAAAIVGLGTFFVLGATTAVIANPVVGRTIPPPDWAMHSLLATSVLSGLLVATYVRNDGPALIARAVIAPVSDERTARRGALGGVLAYLAIGCPVCTTVAILALGSTSTLQWFAPVQPYLAIAGLALLGSALIVRLRGEMTCALGMAAVTEYREESETRA